MCKYNRSSSAPTTTDVPCQPSPCGPNAICQAVGAKEKCHCAPGFTGDPYSPLGCRPKPVEPVSPYDPCEPSPCGPNTRCDINQAAPDSEVLCSCLPGYPEGDPLSANGCRPECEVDRDCSATQVRMGF